MSAIADVDHTDAAVYNSTADYIEQHIAPGLGDAQLTNAQAVEVAQRMTALNDNGKLVDRQDVDFWDVVASVLGDK